ncbi:unnamed protein product [Onchocerca ochengi]|uniref:Methyltransferase domain-containing protein n=1 Tax=Onchocerca ochengi TaxID=42157 RepID=A0A182EF41_ONCOC|nr:unnamed protein product [Onchocerca ochengi]
MVLELPSAKQSMTELDTSLLSLNHSKVLVPYIQAMIAAPFALEIMELEKNGKVWNVLEIGLGTGILNSFLYNAFSNINITAIELEQKMYEIAKKYFGLIEDKHQRIIVGDGLKYLQKIANSSQSKFDVIFIDACYDTVMDEVICPVEAFTLKQNLKIIKEALTKNGSFFAEFLWSLHAANTEEMRPHLLEK